MKSTLCCFVILGAMGTPLARATAQTNAVADADRRGGVVAEPLAPGDAIQLAFSREPDLGGDFPVDESGAVVLPLLGTKVG